MFYFMLINKENKKLHGHCIRCLANEDLIMKPLMQNLRRRLKFSQ